MKDDQSWQERIASLMLGRNGFDDAARAAFGFAVVAMLLELLFSNVSGFLSSLFSYVSLALFLYMIFRVLSRNLDARARENREWVKLWTPVLVASRRKYSYLKEWKTYHKDYYIVTCKQCGQNLRVPKGKGRIRVTCPKCHSVFEKKS